MRLSPPRSSTTSARSVLPALVITLLVATAAIGPQPVAAAGAEKATLVVPAAPPPVKVPKPAKSPKPDPVTAAWFPLSGTAPARHKALVVAAIRAALPKMGRRPSAAGAAFDESAAMIGCSPALGSCLTKIADTLSVKEMVFGAMDAAVVASAAEPEPSADPLAATGSAAAGSPSAPASSAGLAAGKAPGKAPPPTKKAPAPPPGFHLQLSVASARGVMLATQEFDLPGGKSLGAAVKAAVSAVLSRAVMASRGKLVVKSDPPGATVRVDGAEAGTTPVELTLDVGEHTIDALLGTAETTQSVVLTSAGIEVTLDLTRSAAAAAAASRRGLTMGSATAPVRAVVDPDETARRPAKRSSGAFDFSRLGTPTMASLGAGLGLVVAGTVFGVLTVTSHTRFEDRVASLDPPLSEADDLETLRDLERAGKRGKAYAVLGNVLFIGGGIALVGGGVLLVRDLRKPKAAPSDAPGTDDGPAATASAASAPGFSSTSSARRSPDGARAGVVLIPGGAAVNLEVLW